MKKVTAFSPFLEVFGVISEVDCSWAPYLWLEKLNTRTRGQGLIHVPDNMWQDQPSTVLFNSGRTNNNLSLYIWCSFQFFLNLTDTCERCLELATDIINEADSFQWLQHSNSGWRALLFFFLTTVMGSQIQHGFQKDVTKLFTNVFVKTTVLCKLKNQTRIIIFLIRTSQRNQVKQRKIDKFLNKMLCPCFPFCFQSTQKSSRLQQTLCNFFVLFSGPPVLTCSLLAKLSGSFLHFPHPVLLKPS